MKVPCLFQRLGERNCIYLRIKTATKLPHKTPGHIFGGTHWRGRIEREHLRIIPEFTPV